MFTKYISVGVLNTLITLLITLLCYKIFNIDYKISYAIGFLVGFINSIIMNNIYTFKERKNKFNLTYIYRFTFYFFIAFIISELALILFVEIFYFYELISIIVSMLIYTIVSYILFNKFVYKEEVIK